MRGKRRLLDFLVPLSVVAVFFLLELSGLFHGASGWIYDLLTRVKPVVPAAREVLLLDVDDGAVAEVGVWPWSRHVFADGLVLLSEMDARYAVFETPFTRKSPPAIDPSALRQALPDAFDREFSRIEENIQGLFDAIRRGSVRPADSPRYVSELIGLVALGKARLLDAVAGIERDDDGLLGQAARFFGRTYVALDLLPAPDPAVGKDLEEVALQSLSHAVAAAARDPSIQARGIRPPVLPVLTAVRGGGFTDPSTEPGIARRDAALTAAYGGQHFLQVAFTALLDRLGSPGVEIGTERLLLKNADPDGSGPRDISIPLTREGRMLIDRPGVDRPGAQAGGDGFRHLSWQELAMHAMLEEELLAALRAMERDGYLTYIRSQSSLLDQYEYAQNMAGSMLAGGATTDVVRWREARDLFFSMADGFLNGDAESRIIADTEGRLSAPKLTEEEKKGIREVIDRVPGAFAGARKTFAELSSVRALLRESLQGSFCIVALSAGVTPLGQASSDGVLSAGIVNTVLSGRFLREIPPWYGAIFGAVLSVLAALVLARIGPAGTALAGLGIAVFIAAGIGAFFIFLGWYANPITPAGSTALSCALLAIVDLARSRKSARTV